MSNDTFDSLLYFRPAEETSAYYRMEYLREPKESCLWRCSAVFEVYNGWNHNVHMRCHTVKVPFCCLFEFLNWLLAKCRKN